MMCVMFVLFLVNGLCDVPAAVSEKEKLLDPVYQTPPHLIHDGK